MTEETPGAAGPTAETPVATNSGNTCAGIFLIVLALCLLLVGGGCTVVLLALFVDEGSGGGWAEMLPLTLLSLGVFAGGCVAMWFGVRLVRGRYG